MIRLNRVLLHVWSGRVSLGEQQESAGFSQITVSNVSWCENLHFKFFRNVNELRYKLCFIDMKSCGNKQINSSYGFNGFNSVN